MPICANCGSTLRPNANFCPVCGTRCLTPPASLVPATPTGSALAAAILMDRQRNQYPVVDQMTIGRDPANAVHLDVIDVSRQHARIIWQITRWVVMDLNSANGTYVNDQPVYGSAPLAHGDRLRFGSAAELLFVDPTRAGATQQAGGLPQTRQVTPPLPQPAAPGIPAAPAPQLKNWGKRPPQVEGYVLSLRGPFTVEKDGKVGRALLSVGLGLINPALAFIPFAVGKNQIMVTHLRLERYPPDPDRPQAAVTLIGDQTSIVEAGDLVAVWGKEQEGTLFAEAIYNYATDAVTRLK